MPPEQNLLCCKIVQTVPDQLYRRSSGLVQPGQSSILVHSVMVCRLVWEPKQLYSNTRKHKLNWQNGELNARVPEPQDPGYLSIQRQVMTNQCQLLKKQIQLSLKAGMCLLFINFLVKAQSGTNMFSIKHFFLY